MKHTVIYHRADFDGFFCREIARRFLPDAELIGWDYGDSPVPMPTEGTVYILDLSPECMDEHPALEGLIWNRIVWIDHHKSAIEKFHQPISGYRIDGVAACRLAWQWFLCCDGNWPAPRTSAMAPAGVLPQRQDFINREVSEPLAVRFAGEYDIWDKRDPNAEIFQHGLRSEDISFSLLLEDNHDYVARLIQRGEAIKYAQDRQNESIIKAQGFTVQFEGLTMLACNAARYNSLLFTAGVLPEHEGLIGFNFDGKEWRVSLYGVPHRPDVDLSAIAKKYGGVGHKQACGFRCASLPFIKL